MNRLTQKRVNGIKTGYWSAGKKDELVARLAEYEDTGLEPAEVLQLKKNTVQWIPVAERLPEDGYYLATLDGELVGQEEPFTGMCGIENGKWDDEGCVIAWMPLPEPYREVNMNDERDDAEQAQWCADWSRRYWTKRLRRRQHWRNVQLCIKLAWCELVAILKGKG